MKVSLTMAALSAAALILSDVARAEYYMVYPAQATCGQSCYQPCCQTCCSSCSIPIQTKTRIYHDSWRSHDHRHNSYTIDLITNDCVINTGSSSSMIRGKSKHDFVSFSGRAAPKGHYVDLSDNPYDPDLTTGDDEVMKYSGMNNQY